MYTRGAHKRWMETWASHVTWVNAKHGERTVEKKGGGECSGERYGEAAIERFDSGYYSVHTRINNERLIEEKRYHPK
jgi:hypothetical protein